MMRDEIDPAPEERSEEEATIRMLRLAGPRSPVSDVRTARVRGAVQAEWARVVHRRARRRRVVYAGAALAAGVAIALVIERVEWRGPGAAPGNPVAVVERIDGTPRRLSAPLAADDVVRAGEWIETDASARVALRFPDGTSVRLDAGSRVRPLSAQAIELAAGAAYVDTGRDSGRFEVRTALATARDIGTQFEVRLLDDAVRLRVRSGLVELTHRTQAVSARAGTEITWSGAGAVSRPIAVHGEEWAWAARLAPALQIEGVALAPFLERVAREQGWKVSYADPALAREAAEIVLHGSVGGLTPAQAVEVAVVSSGLRHRLEGGDLRVLRDAAPR